MSTHHPDARLVAERNAHVNADNERLHLTPSPKRSPRSRRSTRRAPSPAQLISVLLHAFPDGVPKEWRKAFAQLGRALIYVDTSMEPELEKLRLAFDILGKEPK